MWIKRQFFDGNRNAHGKFDPLYWSDRTARKLKWRFITLQNSDQWFSYLKVRMQPINQICCSRVCETEQEIPDLDPLCLTTATDWEFKSPGSSDEVIRVRCCTVDDPDKLGTYHKSILSDLRVPADEVENVQSFVSMVKYFWIIKNLFGDLCQ